VKFLRLGAMLRAALALALVLAASAELITLHSQARAGPRI